MRLLACLVMLTTCVADESIRLPTLPERSEPEPPKPVQITDLQADQAYIIEADVPCIVLASRDGFVSITSEAGPIRIRSRFAGGSDTVETRVYNAPHIYIIEAKSKGQVELLIIPAGATDASTVIRRTLNVMGHAPQPPPDPFEEDKDEPPPPRPLAEHLTLALVEEVRERTPETTLIINAMAGWDEFHKAGHVYRIYDKDTGEPKGRKAIEIIDSLELPAIVITDTDDGGVVHVGPLPKTMAELRVIVERLTRG